MKRSLAEQTRLRFSTHATLLRPGLAWAMWAVEHNRLAPWAMQKQ